jgi:hypothetical protein
MVYLRGGQFITFDFVVNDEGQVVMAPKTGNYGSYNVNVVPSDAQQIFQIGITVALQVFFAVLGGIGDSMAGAVEEAATDAAEQGAGDAVSASVEDDGVQALVRDNGVTQADLEEAESDASAGASAAITNFDIAGYAQKFKGLLLQFKWRIFFKIIDRIVGIPIGMMTALGASAAREDYDNLPSLNPFVAEGVAPLTGAGSSFTPTGATLDNALVFWGTNIQAPSASNHGGTA